VVIFRPNILMCCCIYSYYCMIQSNETVFLHMHSYNAVLVKKFSTCYTRDSAVILHWIVSWHESRAGRSCHSLFSENILKTFIEGGSNTIFKISTPEISCRSSGHYIIIFDNSWRTYQLHIADFALQWEFKWYLESVQYVGFFKWNSSIKKFYFINMLLKY